jgi:hypothetical protein
LIAAYNSIPQTQQPQPVNAAPNNASPAAQTAQHVHHAALVSSSTIKNVWLNVQLVYIKINMIINVELVVIIVYNVIARIIV